MQTFISKSEIPVPVSIIHVQGVLDGSNYQQLIDEARQLKKAGTRNLILEMSKMTFISSAGLGAIHQIAIMYLEKDEKEIDENWSEYKFAIWRSKKTSNILPSHRRVKLCSPSRDVMKVLDLIRFTVFFDIFSDLQEAISSFHQPLAAAGIQ
jgi:anti-anti-sigma regulatory factor